MIRLRSCTFVLCIGLLAALPLACGSSSDGAEEATPSAGASVAASGAPGGAASSGPSTAPSPSPTVGGKGTTTGEDPAYAGQSWRLDTNDTTIRVWLLRYDREVLEGAAPAPEHRRYDALYFRIKNVGDAPYHDSIPACVTATTFGGRDYGAAAGAATKPAIDEVTILPGESRSGWVTLDVAGALEDVRFAADSGFAEYGDWCIP